MHLLALLGLLQTEMIDFSTLSYNSACEIPTPFIYLKPEKKYPFRVEPTLYKVHVFRNEGFFGYKNGREFFPFTVQILLLFVE